MKFSGIVNIDVEVHHGKQMFEVYAFKNVFFYVKIISCLCLFKILEDKVVLQDEKTIFLGALFGLLCSEFFPPHKKRFCSS